MRIPTKNSSSWGNDVKDISTFVANFDAAFYKLYVVDPSEQNIMVLDPANDGSGYPTKPSRRLPTDRPVDGITDLMIDGDIFATENGQVERLIPAAGWQPQAPADTTLRPGSRYTMLSSPILANGNPSRRIGALYAFDEANHRIVAFNKSDGKYLGQYRLDGRQRGLGGPARHGGAAGRRPRRAADAVVDLLEGAAERPARGGAGAVPVRLAGHDPQAHGDAQAQADEEATRLSVG